MPDMNFVFKRIVMFFAVAYAFTWFSNLESWLWLSVAQPVPMMSLGPFFAARPGGLQCRWRTESSPFGSILTGALNLSAHGRGR
jgi:hypothetical protein